MALAVEYALVLLVCGTNHWEFVHHFCQIDIGYQLSIILGIAVVDLLGKPYQLLGCTNLPEALKEISHRKIGSTALCAEAMLEVVILDCATLGIAIGNCRSVNGRLAVALERSVSIYNTTSGKGNRVAVLR